MAGFSSIRGDEAIMFADNASFDGTERGGKMVSDGQLWIGSTASRHVRLGNITSLAGTITVTNGAGTINLEASTHIPITFVENSGSAVPAGNTLNILGTIVAAGTNPLTTLGAASTVTIQTQYSQAIAATDGTKVGLSAFNSAQFTVDATGFVSTSGTGIGNTITGDSGGALSPTAGNWNILGRSGSKTSGSGSTLTVKSPPYADAGSSTTSTLNSGSFVTAAITLTLPASAGLLDGDLFEYVLEVAGPLIIQAVGTQKIRVGTLLSSAAGTITSTQIGDSVSLRFRASDGFFYATSVIGTWLVA